MNKIITKWIEPYVLLETIKKHAELLKLYQFDGFSKESVKKDFLKSLNEPENFGLYMKNVNIFYLFKGNINIEELFEFNKNDYEETSDNDEPFEKVDLGKAEAGLFFKS